MAEGDKAPKTTEERILDGLAQTYRLVQKGAEQSEQVTGRIDRLGGAIDDLRGIINDLVTALPKPIRYCPPMVAEDGVIYCEGGVKLMRSKKGGDNPKAREWTHPLEESCHHTITTPTDGTQLVKWHNVYESKALTELPEGVKERAWPSQGDGGQSEYPGPNDTEPDDLPF